MDKLWQNGQRSMPSMTPSARMIGFQSQKCDCCGGSGVAGNKEINLSQLSDLEASRQNFCECQLGRGFRLLYKKRVDDFAIWVKETEQRSTENRQKKLAAALSAEVPERFKDASLVGFAQYSGDPEKRSAYQIANTFIRNDGWIINGNDTKKQGLTIRGSDFGIGKSYLATAIYNALTRTRSGAWISYPTFVHAAQQGFRDKVYNMLNAAQDVDVLLIDDLGNTEYPEISAFIGEVIKDIVFYRHLHQKITLITTNRTVPEMIALYGMAVFHRIGELTKIVDMGGKQLRDLR